MNISDKELITRYVSLHEISREVGLSHGHLALLIRNGKLKGWKIGRNWVTTRDAVNEYLAQDRKPGPKRKIPS